MKIIVINGQGGAGKDTFINYCKKEKYDLSVKSFSTVDFVKKIAKNCGWKGEKTDQSRLFLSDLKDAMTKYNDKPYYSVIKSIRHLLQDYYCYNFPINDLIIFIHAREPKDIERWTNELKARTLLIHRPTKKIFTNHADKDVYTIDYDYTIINNGTLDDLKRKAKHFIKKIRKENWESVNYKEIFKLMKEEQKNETNDNR